VASSEKHSLSDYDYDLVTIGAGSGGVRASRIAANHGAKVACFEERYLGGTCVNVGCVPKKLLVYASHYGEDFGDAAGFGWNIGHPEFSWKKLITNKNSEITRLNGIYRRLLDGAGVEIIEKRATLKDSHTVSAGGVEFTAANILIGTGGWPTVPKIPGGELAITSNEAFFLENLPKRIVIIGGGYIAVEFAGIFHGLGTQVTQLYRGPMFLRGFDDDIRAFIATEMRRKGINLRLECNATQITKEGDTYAVTLTSGDILEADCIMFATGRMPNSGNLGLENAGVTLAKNGAIMVDGEYRTNVPHIFAIGDVTDRINLTPVAIAEGHAVADLLFAPSGRKVDYDGVATAVFSQPPMGTVGLTEQEARKQHGGIDVYISDFRAMKHTLSGSSERTMIKMIVDRQSDRVLGVHIVGPEAGEIIQGVAVALKCGATKAQFDATIAIHPTTAEELVLLREKKPDPISP
jgi:glutathione reductase (NADPH)